MNRDLDAFVKAGLNKYREARDVVELFEQEVQDRIRLALEARREWGVLEGRDVKDNGPGRDARYGRWITASVSGSTSGGEETEIDVGLWWNAPNALHPLIVYSQFYAPRALRSVAFSDPRDGVSVFKSGKDTILQSAVPEDLDFSRVLHMQFDMLLAQLAGLKGGKNAGSSARRR